MTTYLDPVVLENATPPPRVGPRAAAARPSRCAGASERARRSPITHLRYAALATEDLRAATAFYDGIWGLYRVAGDIDVVFLGTVGSPEPYVTRLRAAAERRTDLIAFGPVDAPAADALAQRLDSDGVRLAAEPGRLQLPGSGYGFRFFGPNGRLVEVSCDVAGKPFRELEAGESVPRKPSHVVVSSPDVQALKAFCTKYLGLRLSDWLQNLCASCAARPTTTASRSRTARSPTSTTCRSNCATSTSTCLAPEARATGHRPLLGPGRHSSGANVYSYLAGPDGFVVEYTTAPEPSLCRARRYPPAAS